MNDSKDNAYWLLIQLASRARHDFARIGENTYGLTAAQMQTLCLLPADAAIPMNMLSCQMSCDASNVTGIADRLETQGLVVRKDDSSDRRIKMLCLTPKGKILRRRILRDLSLVQPDGLSQLNDQERHQLLDLLTKALATRTQE